MIPDKEIIRLKGDCSPMLLRYVADRLTRKAEDEISVELETTENVVFLELSSPAEILATATFIALVLKAIINTRIWHRKKHWTKEKIVETIEIAILEEKVQDYEITEIRNLNCLQGGKDCPCVICIFSKSTKKVYNIHIFFNGNVLTFEVKNSDSSSK